MKAKNPDLIYRLAGTEVKRINLIFLVTVLFSDFVGGYIVALISDSMPATLASELLLALPAIVYLLVKKVNIRERLRINRIKPSNIFWLILFNICFAPVLRLLNAISMLFATNVASASIFNASMGTNFLVGVFVFAIVPAVLEESVYRGIFYNEYAKISLRGGIILSALLFALMHGNFNQFTYAFVMGLIFCLMVEATDSTVSTMILHFCTNFSSVVLMYALPRMISMLESMYNVAKETGDAVSAQLIEQFFGTENVSAEAYIEQAFASVDPQTIGEIIYAYLPSAFIGGLLAFLIFRKIARNQGRWNHIRAIFGREPVEQNQIPVFRIYEEEPVESEEDLNYRGSERMYGGYQNTNPNGEGYNGHGESVFNTGDPDDIIRNDPHIGYGAPGDEYRRTVEEYEREHAMKSEKSANASYAHTEQGTDCYADSNGNSCDAPGNGISYRFGKRKTEEFKTNLGTGRAKDLYTAPLVAGMIILLTSMVLLELIYKGIIVM